MLTWILVLPLMCLGAFIAHQMILRKKRREQLARREARMKYVKRRRKLMARLQRIVGDELLAARLARAEGMRLKVPSSSIEALSAAIKLARQERDADRLLMGKVNTTEEPAKASPSNADADADAHATAHTPPRSTALSTAHSTTRTGRRRSWHRASPRPQH